MMIKRLLIGTILAGSITGSASAITFAGSSTFQDLTNDSVTFSAMSPTFNFSLNTVGSSTTVPGFQIVMSTVSGQALLAGVTDQVRSTITFTLPGPATGVVNGTASEVYSVVTLGSFTVTNTGVGSVTWAGSTVLNPYSSQVPVTFGDGTRLGIELGNTLLTGTNSSLSGTVGARFTLLATPVPEPVSLSILGTGLVGVGLARRARKTKA